MTPSTEIRRLGVFLDQGLTFRRHIAELTSKKIGLVQHLQKLASYPRNPLSFLIVTIAGTVVMKTALYAADVWCPGL